MSIRPAKSIVVFLCIVVAVLAWKVSDKLDESAAHQQRDARGPAPVQVANVEQGPIALQRVFSGSLEAHAESLVASKLSARVEKLHVALGDKVVSGQLLVELDDAEYQQEIANAEAELALVRANHAEAQSLLTIAERELQRLVQLSQRGSVSNSQLDLAKANQLAKAAQLAVSEARIAQAEAALRAVEIRLAYTRIHTAWQGDSERWVAERLVDEGDNVDSNGALLRIVELDPITAVFHITEREYALLKPGQLATIHTDAFTNERFVAKVVRIAPVFSESTRQARIELEVENTQFRLKPGMFVRATVELQRTEQATIVPQQAIIRRDNQQGVFVVEDNAARWLPVELGIQQGDDQQVFAEGLQGQVVTQGQQLLKEGAPLTIVEALVQ